MTNLYNLEDKQTSDLTSEVIVVNKLTRMSIRTLRAERKQTKNTDLTERGLPMVVATLRTQDREVDVEAYLLVKNVSYIETKEILQIGEKGTLTVG